MRDPIDNIETETDEWPPVSAPEADPDTADPDTADPDTADPKVTDPLIASFAAALSWAEQNIRPVRERAHAADAPAVIPDDVPRFKVRR